MHFIKTTNPPFLFKLVGDKPFSLPNKKLIATHNVERHDNWQLDTEAHAAARRVVETQFGRQNREEPQHEEVPEAEDGAHTETHQKAPHTTFE